MRSPSRTRTAALAAVLLLTAFGCSDDDGADVRDVGGSGSGSGSGSEPSGSGSGSGSGSEPADSGSGSGSEPAESTTSTAQP